MNSRSVQTYCPGRLPCLTNLHEAGSTRSQYSLQAVSFLRPVRTTRAERNTIFGEFLGTPMWQSANAQQPNKRFAWASQCTRTYIVTQIYFLRTGTSVHGSPLKSLMYRFTRNSVCTASELRHRGPHKKLDVGFYSELGLHGIDGSGSRAV